MLVTTIAGMGVRVLVGVRVSTGMLVFVLVAGGVIVNGIVLVGALVPVGINVAEAEGRIASVTEIVPGTSPGYTISLVEVTSLASLMNT